MNIQHKNNPYPPICIRTEAHSIRVFRVNQSPRLKVNRDRAKQAKVPQWLHTHFTYEVFFVVSGKLELLTENGSQEYSNAIVIIPPHISHISLPDGESYCLLFSFDGEETIDKWLERGVCSLPLSSEIAFYIQQLTGKTLERTKESEQAVHFLASLIFLDILNAVKPEHQTNHTKKSRAKQHINAVDSYINTHLH